MTLEKSSKTLFLALLVSCTVCIHWDDPIKAVQHAPLFSTLENPKKPYFWPFQVHCVRAFGKLLEIIRQEGPFPAGLILHSWGGPAEMVPPLAAIPGVYFSFSGHRTRKAPEKIKEMLQQVRDDERRLAGNGRQSKNGV